MRKVNNIVQTGTATIPTPAKASTHLLGRKTASIELQNSPKAHQRWPLLSDQKRGDEAGAALKDGGNTRSPKRASLAVRTASAASLSTKWLSCRPASDATPVARDHTLPEHLHWSHNRDSTENEISGKHTPKPSLWFQTNIIWYRCTFHFLQSTKPQTMSGLSTATLPKPMMSTIFRWRKVKYTWLVDNIGLKTMWRFWGMPS